MDGGNTDTPARLGSLSVDLMREIVELKRDRDSYRELAQQAIHALADLTTRHRRQTERYHALLDQTRRAA